MNARDRRLLFALAFAALAFMFAQEAIGFVHSASFVAPVLLVAVPLLAGRFIGEETIHRVAGYERRSAARGRPPVQFRRPRPIFRVLARGGRLIADALAVRPPPLAVSA
jgi:hypothetical protein